MLRTRGVYSSSVPSFASSNGFPMSSPRVRSSTSWRATQARTSCSTPTIASDAYDREAVPRPKGARSTFVLDYDECMALMIAESRPEEKETMVALVMNFLA